MKQLRFLTICLDGKRIPLNSQERGEMQGEIPYWGANGIVDYVNRYLFDEQLVLLGEDGAPFFDKTKDVAFCVNGMIWVNNHIHVLRPISGLSCNFLTYALNTVDYYPYIEGTTRDKLTQEKLNCIPVALPPSLPEQRAIADFLDRETGRIDALIEKKQRQIELLREKRTALISHAVTKGLDPNAKMKDSGIEWLGMVPEGWAIKRLRYLGCCQNGINIDGESFGTGYPFVSYSDVYNHRELPHEIEGLVQSSVADRERYSVQADDIFFTRTSETIEEIGFPSVCFRTINKAVFAGFLIRFRPHKHVLDSAFSKYYFQNDHLRAFFVKEMNLVTRASLSQDLLKILPVLLPSFQEQIEIAAFLDRETTRIDKLIEKVALSIETLREYRTALISAAVTGKIDVRQEARS